MVQSLIQNTGAFFVPQLILSVITLTLIIGYLIAWRRREISCKEKPWLQSLDPLANVAVAIGLFGSVVGFITAFGGFQKGIDVKVLTHGLATAYYTTGVGIFTSLMATLGSYLLNLLTRNS